MKRKAEATSNSIKMAIPAVDNAGTGVWEMYMLLLVMASMI